MDGKGMHVMIIDLLPKDVPITIYEQLHRSGLKLCFVELFDTLTWCDRSMCYTNHKSSVCWSSVYNWRNINAGKQGNDYVFVATARRKGVSRHSGIEIRLPKRYYFTSGFGKHVMYVLPWFTLSKICGV